MEYDPTSAHPSSPSEQPDDSRFVPARQVITPLDTVPSGTTLDYDVAIVGAGAAGITLALELLPSGMSIVVLEGGDRTASATSAARYRGTLMVPVGVSYPPLDSSRLRYLGGSTNHWGGWCRPLDENVFVPRPGYLDVGWPFDRAMLEPAYERAALWCETGRHEWDAATLCAAAGLASPVVATNVMATPVWRYSPPTRFGTRYEDALENSNVDVFLGANCVGFVVDGRRVEGVRVVAEDGGRRTVRAAQTVLACGGIENIRHLLILARQGVTDLDRSGTLGRGFMEHPHYQAGALLVDADDLADGGRLGAATGTPSDIDGTPFKVGVGVTPEMQEEFGIGNVSFTLNDVQYSVDDTAYGPASSSLWAAARDSDVASVIMYARSEQRPHPDSRITLSSELDDLGMPLVALDWRIAEADLRDVEVARRLVVGELMAQGYGPATSAYPDDYLLQITGGAHHLGAARMHDSADEGVVDATQRVHALDNLFVTGGAVFPSGCFSNPTLTIVALAVRLADTLRERA